MESDERLMLLIQQGSQDAYRKLYERWQDRIIAFLTRRNRSHQHAEEVYHETWINIIKYRDTFQVGFKFKPWIYRIVIRTGMKHDRKNKISSFNLSMDDFNVNVEDLPAPYRSMSIIEAKEALGKLLIKLNQLPDVQRDALLLAYDGLTLEEIAGALQLGTAASAKNHVYRARKALREEEYV